MSFAFAPAKARRRPSLTPMIDVVFLLLVFFMLAARFGQEGALDLRIANGSTDTWEGPPRLVQIDIDALRLNGQDMTEEILISALTRLTDTQDDPVLIQPSDGVSLQRLLDVLSVLEGAGFTSLALTPR